MRYIGKQRTRTVTLHLGFLDEPVKVRNLTDLPPGYHFKLANPEGIEEVLQAVLDEDLAHIILYQGSHDDLEEFMNAWMERSEAQDETEKRQQQQKRNNRNQVPGTTPEPRSIADILNQIITDPNNPFGRS